MKRALLGRAGAALLAVVALVGCAEDVGPVTASWEQLYAAMGKTADGLRKQYNDTVGMVKALPAIAPGDTKGQALGAKLNSALAVEAGQLDEVDGTIKSGSASVHGAMGSGKVATIQAAIDKAKAAFDGAVAKVSASSTATAGMLSALKSHQAAFATGIYTAGSEQDFTDIDFKAGKAEFLFDRPNTQATLDKLLAYVNSCPELTVNIIGHTSNEGTAAVNKKLSVDRAIAVKKWLESKGVPAKKIHSVSGVGATSNVAPEPAPNSKDAKAMPQVLEELRRRNRRVTVDVVTPCPEN